MIFHKLAMNREVKEDKKKLGNTRIQSTHSQIYTNFSTNKIIQAIINCKASSTQSHNCRKCSSSSAHQIS